MKYLANAFWLLVPILAFNATFFRFLPASYQTQTFWRDIPAWIRVPEHASRILVLLLPLGMRMDFGSPFQSKGFGLYLAGMLLYFLSWGVQIAFPKSAWSLSAAGFMAPAYTPAIWILGIGLMADGSTLPGLTVPPWIYWICGAGFLIFHNLHAGLVYTRLHGV